MVKVLHMAPPDINNGIYRYIFNHMEYMDRQRFCFAFLTKGAAELKQTSEYKKYGFDVYGLENVQRGDREKFREEILGILGKGFDIVHLHTSSWRGFMIEEIAMELHVPRVIVHSHSTGIDEKNSEEREARICAHENFKRQFSMKYATDVWACSKQAADWLYGMSVPKDRIRILPNAVDTRRCRYDPEKRRELREQMGLSDRYVIGNIGRYTFQKNQEFLIRAAAKACKKNEKLCLLCLGEGELLPQLRSLADKLGIADHVCCMDWQENAEDYLQVMDVFCLPSRFEGLPLSVIEAQAAGLRCFVSDTVTREVRLTELVTFLPLEQERWVWELLNCNYCNERTGWDERIARAGYDIRSAANKLERMYEGNDD